MGTSNILYFSSFGSIKGGGQKSLLLLLRHIDKKRFLPKCVTPDSGSFTEILKEEEIDYFVVPMGPTKSFNIPRILSTIIKLYRLIKAEKIDVVHTDGPRNTFYAGFAAKLAGIPLVCHVRVVDKPRFDDKVMTLLSNAFIFVSKSAQERFSWARDKIPGQVIYNGIDVKEFQEYQINSHELKEDNLYNYKIGCIGRIEEAKGQEYLIRAADKIINEFENVTFIFIGEEEKSYMSKIISETSSIKKNIKFMGYLENPYTVMKHMDLIVLPSLSEGFSRVILESMAMKKPVIATDVGGNPEAVIDGITGFLISPCDPDAISEKVISLLKDRNRRINMGEAGYQRINTLFRLDKNVKQIEKLYDRLLDN